MGSAYGIRKFCQTEFFTSITLRFFSVFQIEQKKKMGKIKCC